MNTSFSKMIENSWGLTADPDRNVCWQVSQQAWAQPTRSSVNTGTATERVQDIFFDETLSYIDHCIPAQVQSSSCTLHHLVTADAGALIISSEQRVIDIDCSAQRFAPGMLLTTVSANQLCSFMIGNTLICVARINDEWSIYEHKIEWSLGELSTIDGAPKWLEDRWNAAVTFSDISMLMGHRINLQAPSNLTLDEIIVSNPGALITQWALQLSASHKRILDACFADLLSQLEETISILNEHSVLAWLEQRDDLQALADIVCNWQPKLISDLKSLDSGFPFTSFSAIHTDSEQLYSSRLQNPDAWWSHWCRALR